MISQLLKTARENVKQARDSYEFNPESYSYGAFLSAMAIRDGLEKLEPLELTIMQRLAE